MGRQASQAEGYDLQQVRLVNLYALVPGSTETGLWLVDGEEGVVDGVVNIAWQQN